MNIRILSLTGQIIELENIDEHITVAELKEVIEAQESIPTTVQRLLFSGQELDDTQTLEKSGINDNSSLNLVVRQTRELTPEEIAQPTHISNEDVQVSIPTFGAPDHIVAGISPSTFSALQLSRLVKMFAVVDSIFVLLWSLSQPILIVALILPLCGYYGSINYNALLVIAYTVFLALSIAYRIYFSAVVQVSAAFIILNALGILFEIYIAIIATRFIRTVKALSSEDREQLLRIERLR